MDDLLNQMGRRIFSRRKELYLTQEELAEQAGVTPQTISSAELGKKALRPENIIRISAALNISTDYLLTGIVNEADHSTVIELVSTLNAAQYRHLEAIIRSYVAALQETGQKKEP